MMLKAWGSVEEVPCYSSMSHIKFQGHTAKKIVDLKKKNNHNAGMISKE